MNIKLSTMKLVIDSHQYLSSYDEGLSNHIPMALFALDQLNANENKINSFYNQYVLRLEKNKYEAFPIDIGSWRNFLSLDNAYSGYITFFKSEIENRGLRETINLYVRELMPGVSGAAFHPLIRLAYAIEMNCVDEVSHSLAAWAVAYQKLDNITFGNNTDIKLKECLGILREKLTKRNFKSSGYGIFVRMKNISEQDEFKEFINSFSGNDVKLDDLAKLSIHLYLSTDDNFTALHAVTS